MRKALLLPGLLLLACSSESSETQENSQPTPSTMGDGGDSGVGDGGSASGDGDAQDADGLVRFTFVPDWRPDVEGVALEDYSHVAWFVLSSLPDGSLDLGAVDESLLTRLVERASPLGVKVLISIGQGEKLQPVASKAELREKFIGEVLDFVEKHQLDGVDLDWEPYDWEKFPNPDDTLGYGELASELCPQLQSKSLLCTADVYSSSFSGVLIPDELLQSVDFVNVMAYDYEGSWSSKSGHHGSWASTRAGLRYWEEERGVPREKITIGLAAYGRAFGAVDGPRQSYEGLGSKSDGIWGYDEIAQAISDDNLTPTQDPDGAYVAIGEGEELETVFYLSPQDVSSRVEHAEKEGYLGVMVWEATMDVDGGESLSAALTPRRRGG